MNSFLLGLRPLNKRRRRLKCKDCVYLSKTESKKVDGSFDLYCAKHDLHHAPMPERNLEYLVCVEDERRRHDRTRSVEHSRAATDTIPER